MSWAGALSDILRRARLRGLQEGQIQRARAEAFGDKAHDDAERFNDYGFKAHPVDGQGLILNVGGMTIVLRMDRLAESPELAPYEVALWHREGHMVRLMADRRIEVQGCTEVVVNATSKVTLNAPETEINGNLTVSGNTSIAGNLNVTSGATINGRSFMGHTHGGVRSGGDTSGSVS